MDESTLGLYNQKVNEPEPSVMESSDFRFASSKYEANDFRFLFVNEFISKLNEKTKHSVVNVKLSRPRLDSNFINCYVYVDDLINNRIIHIRDRNDSIAIVFYNLLEEYKLPAVTQDTRVQFIVKDYSNIVKAYTMRSVWTKLRPSVLEKFTEVQDLSFYSNYYIFLKNEDFEWVIDNEEYLDNLKKYCYSFIDEKGTENTIKYEDFYILVDDYKNYSSIGGHHYFNSDLMGNVTKV